jgi:hypothetical protein
MGVIVTAESEYGKELAKWNAKRPPAAYPRMLYRAQLRPDGVYSVHEVDDRVFGGRPGAAESWTFGCQFTVNDEAEHRKARDGGWRDSHAEAMEYQRGLEKFVSDAAAHRHHEDRLMGEQARAEAEAADASTVDHVAEVPEKRRGWPKGKPRKQQQDAA